MLSAVAEMKVLFHALDTAIAAETDTPVNLVSLFLFQKVIPAKYLDDKTVYHLQPSGSFVVGGPQVGGVTALIFFGGVV